MGEPAIGALIIVPAAIDAYRYFYPEATWAKWASRTAKIATDPTVTADIVVTLGQNAPDRTVDAAG